ncbi:MAG TPA: hypothetical protein VIN72_03360 [Lutibacter sp.]
MKIFNFVLEKIVMPLGDLLTGTTVMKDLKKWRMIVSLSEQEIETYSQARLLKVLNFASTNIPFYRKHSQYRDDNPYIWIKQFPIMRKSIIRNNIDSMLSKPKSKLIKSVTSGSSGEQGIIYKEKKDISNGQALILLLWGWADFYPGKAILQTGMTSKRGFVKSLKDFLLRTKYYVAFGLSDDEVEKLLIKQKGKKNWHLAGYASSLYVLADVCCRKNITGVTFDKAISFGDKMFPHYRKRIKEAFGCDVIDTYGLSEDLTIATQKDNQYYYILSPHVYVEILDDNGNEVNDGEMGHVIATSLDAYAMPLIRFDTGDLAIKLPREKYPPKRDLNLPMMERIIGRDTDIVKTSSGKYMIVHFFTGIFEFIPQIKQFKVVQRDLNGMEIEYIPGENFTSDICVDIENKIQGHLNEKFPIKWIEVKEFLPTLSGKPQIIQSYIKKSLQD